MRYPRPFSQLFVSQPTRVHIFSVLLDFLYVRNKLFECERLAKDRFGLGFVVHGFVPDTKERVLCFCWLPRAAGCLVAFPVLFLALNRAIIHSVALTALFTVFFAANFARIRHFYGNILPCKTRLFGFTLAAETVDFAPVFPSPSLTVSDRQCTLVYAT